MGQIVEWYAHHASMCLQREHAKMISTAPWKEYYHDCDDIFDGIGAPDEFLFGTTLHAMGVDISSEVWRETTTDWELPVEDNVRHPVCWNHLDERVNFYTVSDDMEVQGINYMSLRELMIERFKQSDYLWGYGPCFFRKVAHSVQFKDFIPWKLCNMLPPVIDVSIGLDETQRYRENLNIAAFSDPND